MIAIKTNLLSTKLTFHPLFARACPLFNKIGAISIFQKSAPKMNRYNNNKICTISTFQKSAPKMNRYNNNNNGNVLEECLHTHSMGQCVTTMSHGHAPACPLSMCNNNGNLLEECLHTHSRSLLFFGNLLEECLHTHSRCQCVTTMGTFWRNLLSQIYNNIWEPSQHAR